MPAVSLTSEALAPLITPEKLPAPTLKVVAPSWTSPAPDREATATVLPEKEAEPPAATVRAAAAFASTAVSVATPISMEAVAASEPAAATSVPALTLVAPA